MTDDDTAPFVGSRTGEIAHDGSRRRNVFSVDVEVEVPARVGRQRRYDPQSVLHFDPATSQSFIYSKAVTVIDPSHPMNAAKNRHALEPPS